MNTKFSIKVLGWVAAAVLSACGGGGSSNSTDDRTSGTSTVTAPVGAPTATGSTKSLYQGPISGLGSVIVNGMRFSVVGANLTDDDHNTLTSADMHIGMNVTVSGSGDQQAQTGVATSVELVHGTRGSITAINTVVGALTVMGQQVVVNVNTAYSGVTGLAALATGDRVEVHGITQPDGSVTATLIEKKTLAIFGTSGPLAALDTSNKTFTLGSLTIDYSTASVTGILNNGVSIKVRSSAQPVNGRLLASAIEAGSATAHYTTSTTLKIKGVASAPNTSNKLMVAGTAVDLSAVTLLGGTTVKAGDVIEVRGTWNGSTLVANQVEFEGYRDAQMGGRNELYGTISAYTSLANFVVNGVSVDASAIQGLSAALLRIGTYVEVKGALQGSTLKASKLEIK